MKCRVALKQFLNNPRESSVSGRKKHIIASVDMEYIFWRSTLYLMSTVSAVNE